MPFANTSRQWRRGTENELMTLKHLPPTFCWTRIGADSAEDLPTTVLRKEWERRLGRGRFLWGIGQSLGESAQAAAHRLGSLVALFTPVASRSRGMERARQDMLLWNAWIDASGQVRQLPSHTFITSRATLPSGRRREQHHALVCASPAPLSIGTRLRVVPDQLRSVATGKPLGAAQAAAVVDCVVSEADSGARSYPVAFAIPLDAPYTVRLAQPTALKARDLARVDKAAREGDVEAYIELVERLRGRAAGSPSRGFTRDLFDLPAAEPTAAYTDLAKRLGGRHPAEPANDLSRDLFDLSVSDPDLAFDDSPHGQGNLLL
ncbi:MAG: hypothetical protein GAK40_01199 [Burkholderia plantarii]|nr:MAG: hypothetical protein GAK40_01199 [Burkholderia plantarii]